MMLVLQFLFDFGRLKKQRKVKDTMLVALALWSAIVDAKPPFAIQKSIKTNGLGRTKYIMML